MYCPYCGSDKIHSLGEEETCKDEFECEECQRHWRLVEDGYEAGCRPGVRNCS